jgi:hypothetical protein
MDPITSDNGYKPSQAVLGVGWLQGVLVVAGKVLARYVLSRRDVHS